MAVYETMFILQPELESEAEEELMKNLQAVLQRLGGEITKTDDWGKRKLAYAINKFTEGHYYVLQFTGSHEIVPELEHFFRVNDAVIRFIIVREDE
ncbi:MAG: 30S ribosomal protein S6 [Dethiobacteria bacterium]|nr:30S ribosomal protein S6 [Bacillota bacterium]NMD32825.1 30S ribosomal protein S6 [Bacillota bacterium]HOB28650.1 30S ribosomal protein S6 [Bacillota bacterium]HPZ41338.1 30S ribosomal protein S6 [Bacillota bacterium]HQD52353.1 30S ribosomal protein S6 [Bacillota bacterium]